MRSLRLASLVAVGLLAACTAGSASPSPTPAPQAPTPSPTPSPTPAPSAADFTLDVLPAEEPVEARVAIPGQKICFLVVVKDGGGGSSPATISAVASGASVVDVRPAQLAPGEVGEVWVVPDPATTEVVDGVTISATRAGVVRTTQRSIRIMPMIDERAKDAQPYFERWVAWLAAEQPELGITAETAWEPVFVSTFLVVSHYSYYSDEWELTLSWHNMIPPDDWTEITLRHRGTETAPSLAFHVDSVAGATAPHAVTPPEAIFR